MSLLVRRLAIEVFAVAVIIACTAVADETKPSDNCFENIANYPNTCLESLYDIKNVENAVMADTSNEIQVWLNTYCNELCMEAANVYYNCLGKHDHIHYLRSVACTQHEDSNSYCLVHFVNGKANGNFSLSSINSTCCDDDDEEEDNDRKSIYRSSPCCSQLQLLHQHSGCCVTSLTSDSVSGLSQYVSKSYYQRCELSLPRACSVVYKHSGAELTSPFSCTIFLIFVIFTSLVDIILHF